MSEDKWVKVVAKLNKLTQEEVLEWTEGSPVPLHSTECTVHSFYTVLYKSKILGIFDLDYGEWRKPILAFLQTETNDIIWQVPEVSGIDNLLESVRYKAAGVENFVEELLRDE